MEMILAVLGCVTQVPIIFGSATKHLCEKGTLTALPLWAQICTTFSSSFFKKSHLPRFLPAQKYEDMKN
jgi:hypothetical protein